MKHLIFSILTASIFASDIQPYAALQMAAGEQVREKQFYNPQGRFGVRYTSEYYLSPYIEHISSIPNAFDGYGFNMVGINAVSPEYKNASVCGGYAHKPEWGKNNKSYSTIFDDDFYRYGIKYRNGNQYLYLESIQDRMYSFGIEWVF